MLIKTFRMLPLFLLVFLVTAGSGHCMDKWPKPPPGQPEQMWSQVEYDPNLDDPFFYTEERSYPIGYISFSDGIPISVFAVPNNDEVPTLVRLTAKCFSNTRGSIHRVRFCEARMTNSKDMDVLIFDKTPAFNDNLLIKIRDGKFMSQFWTHYYGGFSEHTKWKTVKQHLVVRSRNMMQGKIMRGFIRMECVEVSALKNDGRRISFHGVFNPVIKHDTR